MSIQRGKQVWSKLVMTTLLVGGLLILSSCSNNAQKNQGKNGKATSTNVRDSILPPPPAPAPPGTENTPYQYILLELGLMYERLRNEG